MTNHCDKNNEVKVINALNTTLVYIYIYAMTTDDKNSSSYEIKSLIHKWFIYRIVITWRQF